MYCNRCGSDQHFAGYCDRTKKVVEVDEIVGTTAYVDLNPVPKAEGTTYVVRCSKCGSTPETFADAEKWRLQREKRKAYMKKYRQR